MTLSKVDVAVIQFESAITAYKTGAFIEAIALAGGAEEILGKLCEFKKKEPAITSFINIAKKHDEKIEEKKYANYLNKHRNALKHFDADKEFHIEVNLEDAKAMLIRVTINFVRLGLTPTELIDDFICEMSNELKTLKASGEFVADSNPVN